MRCSLPTIVVFVVITIFYGSSYAIVRLGLDYFTAGVFQTLRMLSALAGTLIILIARYVLDHKKIREHIKNDLKWKDYLWLCIGGLVNLGVPHCLITVGQTWVSSASVQLMQPFSTTAGAIFGHFFFKDEPFTCNKAISLLLALVGVVLTGVPSFLHAGATESNAGITNLLLGYALVIISIIMFGVAPGIFKLKTPRVDITLSVCIQLFVSAVFCFIWSLIFDGPSQFFDNISGAPAIAYMWPVLVGILVSCISIHGFMYLIGEIGTFGSNLMPFGQILVGVVTGVAFLDEWNGYRYWEIIMCCIGIVFLCVSLYFGFRKDKKQEEIDAGVQEEEEELADQYPMPAEL